MEDADLIDPTARHWPHDRLVEIHAELKCVVMPDEELVFTAEGYSLKRKGKLTQLLGLLAMLRFVVRFRFYRGVRRLQRMLL